MPTHGGRRYLERWGRAALGELVATALLVFLGLASLVPPAGGGARPLTDPALAFGFVVTALVVVFGPVSGAHMNPAVTVAALVAGQLRPAPAALYVVAQLLGGVIGAAALWGVQPEGASPAGHVCAHPAGSAASALAMEAVLTGTLALVCCALWAAHDPAAPDRAAPLKVGLTVAGVVYAGGLVSGASLNPARSLGPALVEGDWDHLWVYMVGPVVGALVAAALHRWVLRVPTGPTAPAPPPDCALPLHDKTDA